MEPLKADPQRQKQTELLRARLFEVRREVLKPPPKLTLVEWADEFRFLPAESAAEPGRWRTSRVEVARGPMEAITDPAVHTVSVMCCTQLMKTEIILNTIGFHISQDPAPMIVMQPSVELAEAFSKDRVDKMIEVTPALQGKVAEKKSRDGGNTITHKQFPGGHLTMIGANAPGQLAMRPVRIVLCDEIDKYPASAGKEGDPIKLLSERAATFWNYKLIFVCSPTIDGLSRIAQEYENGDQRVYEVPCPHCAHAEEMKWANVKWPEGNPRAALYHCPECRKSWTEQERQRAIRRGKWRATKPFNGHASFRASKLASPWEDMGRLAVKWAQAQGKPEQLKTFVNTQLAETWKEAGDAPEWRKLYDRREPYRIATVPEGAVFITMGTDVQKDRIESQIVGWGPGLERWTVDYRIIMGDTSDLGPTGPWERLRELIAEEFVRETTGELIPISMVAIDSGFNTQTVYQFVRRFPPNKVIATKGVDKQLPIMGQPTAVDIAMHGKRIRKGLQMWPVGVGTAKTELYGALKMDNPTAEELAAHGYPTGFVHFPEMQEEFFKQLTAEMLVKKIVKGFPRYEWVKTYDRNEVLDTAVLARAAAARMGIDRFTKAHWERLGAKRIEKIEPRAAYSAQTKPAEPGDAPSQPKKPRIVRRKSSGFL